MDLREHLAPVAALLRRRATRSAFDGQVGGFAGFANQRYLDHCRIAHAPTATMVIFTRDIGHHTSGWMRNPDYERCLHLSLSPAPDWTLLPDAEVIAASRGTALQIVHGLQVADHDARARRAWVEAFFGDDARYVWMESAKSGIGKRREVTHWRLFCDPSWTPLLPRGEVYSSDFTEKGWRSASQVWEEDAVLIQSTVDPT